jgi:phosphatidylglycerol---prolipoprotein diacylglyceryl transferase
LPETLLLPLSALTFPNIDPVVLQIGPVAIRWYGLAWIAGIVFAWWYAKRQVSNEALWPAGKTPCKPADIDDFLIWAALGTLIGGRIGYVLFYDFAVFMDNPLRIFALWEGGMSFHGGFLGTTLSMILFARSRGINVWSLFDVVAAGVPVGLGLVRVANFINSELWGRPTDVAWGVIFPNGGPFPRHPSQLYEAALEGLVLFVMLRMLTHWSLQLRSPGLIAGTFVAGYGLSRIIVEFYREPDAHIGYLAGNWLTMGMVLSLPMVIVGLWAVMSARRAAASSA